MVTFTELTGESVDRVGPVISKQDRVYPVGADRAKEAQRAQRCHPQGVWSLKDGGTWACIVGEEGAPKVRRA